MKNMVTLIILLCISQSLSSDNACFSDELDKDSKSECQKRSTGSSNSKCCYVKFTTDSTFPDYHSLCVDVLKSDLDDGMFEEVMKTIEGGDYSGTGWSRHEKQFFKNYASIKEFDCKSKYLTVSFLLFVFFML